MSAFGNAFAKARNARQKVFEWPKGSGKMFTTKLAGEDKKKDRKSGKTAAVANKSKNIALDDYKDSGTATYDFGGRTRVNGMAVKEIPTPTKRPSGKGKPVPTPTPRPSGKGKPVPTPTNRPVTKGGRVGKTIPKPTPNPRRGSAAANREEYYYDKKTGAAQLKAMSASKKPESRAGKPAIATEGTTRKSYLAPSSRKANATKPKPKPTPKDTIPKKPESRAGKPAIATAGTTRPSYLAPSSRKAKAVEEKKRNLALAKQKRELADKLRAQAAAMAKNR